MWPDKYHGREDNPAGDGPANARDTMPIDRKPALVGAIAAIHRRWGATGVSMAAQLQNHSAVAPTGFPELDGVLQGGLPCGRISEVYGRPTSGTRSLALGALAQAQQQKRLTAYIDLQHTFDAEHAAHTGLDLHRLVLVRPRTVDEARQIMQALVATRTIDMLVLDHLPVTPVRDTRRLADALTHLLSALAGAAITLLVLRPVISQHVTQAGDTLAHRAAVRLLLEHERWHERHGDVWGYDAQVHVIKQPRAGVGGPVRVTFTLPDV